MRSHSSWLTNQVCRLFIQGLFLCYCVLKQNLMCIHNSMYGHTSTFRYIYHFPRIFNILWYKWKWFFISLGLLEYFGFSHSREVRVPLTILCNVSCWFSMEYTATIQSQRTFEVQLLEGKWEKIYLFSRWTANYKLNNIILFVFPRWLLCTRDNFPELSQSRILILIFLKTWNQNTVPRVVLYS